MKNTAKHPSASVHGRAKTLYKLLRKIGNGLAMQYDEKNDLKRPQAKY